MITICFVYFKSLGLANFIAALHALRRQGFAGVESIVVLDNDTNDDAASLQAIVDSFDFPVPTFVLSRKHGDPTRTHAWSSNEVVRFAVAPWVLFTRADYLLDFDLVQKFAAEKALHGDDWNGFITANVFHLSQDVGECELTDWRERGPSVLRALGGTEADYTIIDAGVWMARKAAFDAVGGLDERLTGWGHAQTEFQYRLHKAGVEFVRIPEALFFHPMHAGDRDIEQAHKQLGDAGINLQELWRRHEGVQPYGERQ